MSAQTFASLIDSAETVGGHDLHDKAELVGQEMVITSATFSRNDRDVTYVYCTAMLPDGSTVEFNDSSKTGIRGQISDYLDKKGVEVDYATGEVHDLRLWAPRGLRVSTFEVQDRGRTKTAKTYYLTSKR